MNNKSALLSPTCGKDAGLGGGEKKVDLCADTNGRSNIRDQTLTERRSHEIARERKSVLGRAFLGSGIAWLVGFALCPVGGDATRDEV